MKKIFKFFILLSTLIGTISCGKATNPPANNEGGSENITSEGSTAYEIIDKSVSNIKTKDNYMVTPFNTIVNLRTFCERDYLEIYPIFNEEMQRLHILFDRYNDFVDKEGNDIVNLKSINESYGSGNKLVVDQDIIDLLKMSIELSELTRGYFNPTLGELIDTWNYYYEDGKQYVRFSPYCFEEEDPSVEDINLAKEKIIPYDELDEYIIIDDSENTVEFKKYQDVEKITISLGAIAKGYAVEKAKCLVEQYDVPLMIDGGSSSSYGIGSNPNPNRNYWSIGLAAPYKVATRVEAMAYLRFDDTYTLSVSGDYESCYRTNEGIIRHHILNPYSGYPENINRIISLKSDRRSDILDGLSTALFSIESTDKVMEIVNDVEGFYDMDIDVLLEREVDKENKKIDLHLTYGYDSSITKVNPSYFNSKIYL